LSEVAEPVVAILCWFACVVTLRKRFIEAILATRATYQHGATMKMGCQGLAENKGSRRGIFPTEMALKRGKNGQWQCDAEVGVWGSRMKEKRQGPKLGTSHVGNIANIQVAKVKCSSIWAKEVMLKGRAAALASDGEKSDGRCGWAKGGGRGAVNCWRKLRMAGQGRRQCECSSRGLECGP
jgi:hypothetical protein